MSAMHIGNKVDYSKTSLKELADAIKTVMSAGFEYRASEKTVIRAIEILTSLVEVGQVAVSNCNFVTNADNKSEPTKVDDPEEYTQDTGDDEEEI